MAMIEKIRQKLITSLVLALMIIGIGVGALAQDVGSNAIYIPALANAPMAGDGQSSDDPYEVLRQRAIDLVAADYDMALHLATYPGWVGDAWPESEGSSVWYVQFIQPQPGNDNLEEGEWLGDANVNLDSGELVWVYAPRELTTEEFQQGLQKVEAFLKRDPDIQAMLGDDASFWEHDTYYNRWDKQWETSYWYGLDGIVVRTSIGDNERVYIDSIGDPNAFEAEERDTLRRNQAIELAYESEGIDQALDNVDNWRAYVEDQSSSPQANSEDAQLIYSVEFVGDGETLFYALVDINSWQIIESWETRSNDP